MRGSVRIPAHIPTSWAPPKAEPDPSEGEDKFVGRPCYQFNRTLRSNLNDTRCSHCRFYLTSACPHIDEFLDDVDDLSPE